MMPIVSSSCRRVLSTASATEKKKKAAIAPPKQLVVSMGSILSGIKGCAEIMVRLRVVSREAIDRSDDARAVR